MLSDFLFLNELQSFIASFIGEEKKLALRFPASPNKRPPPSNPLKSSVFPIPTALRIKNRFGLQTGASGRKIS